MLAIRPLILVESSARRAASAVAGNPSTSPPEAGEETSTMAASSGGGMAPGSVRPHATATASIGMATGRADRLTAPLEAIFSPLIVPPPGRCAIRRNRAARS